MLNATKIIITQINLQHVKAYSVIVDKSINESFNRIELIQERYILKVKLNDLTAIMVLFITQNVLNQ